MITIISLGAGVQSSTMALMAARGEITPMPDCAIFADTGAEPQAVYQWLDFLERQLPYPVHRVSAGNLRDEIIGAMSGSNRIDARPPFFTAGGGMLRRQCTQDYKILPIQRKIGEMIGHQPRSRWPTKAVVSQWIGISTDEAHRMKPSQLPCVENRWPLIELGLSRARCLEWFDANGLPNPPKSACTFCPYHDDVMWRDMKKNDPVSFADAVAVDAAIRPGVAGNNRPQGEGWFLHRSLKPLSEIDFRNAKDIGQLSLFGDECEGMCGL
jgi:hypothetical protein